MRRLAILAALALSACNPSCPAPPADMSTARPDIACAAPRTYCNDITGCVALRSDPLNCGACNSSCMAGPATTCIDGVCK